MSKRIRVGLESGRPCVAVDDYELSDFVDDYLTEHCDIEVTHRGESGGPVGSTYRLYFAPAVAVSELTEALKGIDASEVERVWRLNNKTT